MSRGSKTYRTVRQFKYQIDFVLFVLICSIMLKYLSIFSLKGCSSLLLVCCLPFIARLLLLIFLPSSLPLLSSLFFLLSSSPLFLFPSSFVHFLLLVFSDPLLSLLPNFFLIVSSHLSNPLCFLKWIILETALVSCADPEIQKSQYSSKSHQEACLYVSLSIIVSGEGSLHVVVCLCLVCFLSTHTILPSLAILFQSWLLILPFVMRTSPGLISHLLRICKQASLSRLRLRWALAIPSGAQWAPTSLTCPFLLVLRPFFHLVLILLGISLLELLR